MNIDLSYELSPAELKQGIRELGRGRLSLWYAVAVFLVLGVALLTAGRWGQPTGVMFISGAVVYALLLTVGARIRFRKRALALCRPRRIRFTEDHFAIDTETAHSEVRWDGVIRIGETSDTVLLYQDRRVAIIIPKRAFSADHLSAFRRFAATRQAHELASRNEPASR
jgi:hypothetical protein